MVHMPSLGMWVIVGIIGLLFFGKRLPEVGKSVAGAIVNFKKGLKEAQDEVERAGDTSSLPAKTEVAALPSDAKFDPYTGKPIARPKFDPYTGKPLDETTVESTEPVHSSES